MFKKAQSGFTLIEVLVVITVVGILAAVVYSSFDGAREQARNKALMSELKEVQLALEVYKAQNGTYPAAESVCDSVSGTVATVVSSGCGILPYISGLSPTFISSLPSHNDSRNTNCDIEYKVDTTNNWYKLTATRCLEGATQASEGIQYTSEFARCLASCGTGGSCDPTNANFYESMAVYSNGGECQ